MDLALLLGVLIIAPLLVIGAIQALIYHIGGIGWLQALSAVVVVICGAMLVSEYRASPVYGNKSGLVGLGTAAIALIMMQNLAAIALPLLRRYLAWDKDIEARWASEKIEQSGTDL